MFKMVIADDELRTLEVINSCLNWNDYDIEIVGQARNGIQALELVRAINPDILLTDIKMPKMDGIELTMTLREEFPNLKVIFITGYSDISYIKSAFKYDVIDYILKPVDPDELEAVILKTVEARKLEKNIVKNRLELEAKIKQSMPLLQEKFFGLLISNELTDRSEILDRMDFLGIDLPKIGLYMVISVNIDDYYLIQESCSIYEKQLMAFSIVNTISEVINGFTKGFAFEYNRNEFVGIMSFNVDFEDEDIEDKIEKIASEIKSNINKYLKISVTIGIGEWVDSIEKVPFSYQRAMLAANQKLLLGKNNIIYVDITKHENETEFPLDIKDMESIYIALRLGSYERAESVANKVFCKIKNIKTVDKQYIHGICLQLISIVNRAMIEFYESLSAGQINIYELVNILFKLETLEDLKNYILSTFKAVCDNIIKSQCYSSKRVIEDIKSIIYEKFHEDITINSIAKDVYLTPSYICLLFKQETGETINSFLTRVRVEKAKELIKGKTTKLYEISRKVGYCDPKYFSKVFKKYTGVSPSEFS